MAIQIGKNDETFYILSESEFSALSEVMSLLAESGATDLEEYCADILNNAKPYKGDDIYLT